MGMGDNVIIKPNKDGTYRVRFNGLKVIVEGKETEAAMVFPRVSKEYVDFNGDEYDSIHRFNVLPYRDDDNGTIFSFLIQTEEE